MADALKPCPFCGNETARLNQHAKLPSLWHILCMTCDAHLRSSFSRAEAIVAWNRRPPAATTDEMVVAACKAAYGPAWSFAEAEMMRAALTAAIAFDRDATIDECAAAAKKWKRKRIGTDRSKVTIDPYTSRHEGGEIYEEGRPQDQISDAILALKGAK